MSADGPEQRTAELEERAAANFEALVFDDYERDIDDLDVLDATEADHNLEVSIERGNMAGDA